MNGETKISSTHRDRLAVIYLRQSSMAQVREHTESTTRQYGLAEVAVSLGWGRQDVVVIDTDLGVSGRWGVARAGFTELVSRVCSGEVGAIFGIEISRLARSNAEVARLMEFAAITQTLLIDADGIYDPGDINDRMLLGMKSTIGEVELHVMAQRLAASKKAAAERGELRTPLPVGSVHDQAARRAVEPDGTVRTSLLERPRTEWPVLIHDHHEGYLSWAEYLANETKLAANRTNAGARPPREGSALCQGIITCGSCGKPMRTNYRSGQKPSYEGSRRADRLTTPTCRSIAASAVDVAVADRLLQALDPAEIALALAAADDVTDRHQRISRAAELAVERARYEADRAERAFCQVEPENRLVARTLEARWET